jgi:hypothetical protein
VLVIDDDVKKIIDNVMKEDDILRESIASVYLPGIYEDTANARKILKT